MELQLILRVALGGVVLAPNHLAQGSNRVEVLASLISHLGSDWGKLLDCTNLYR